MTPTQISLVQSSFSKVAPIASQAAALFYGKLFELNPDVRPLFKEDLADQGDKLMKMIGVAVSGLNNLDALVPAVQQLGARHVDYGVKNEHYDDVGSALLWTLGEGLGDDFTDEVKEAWTITYTTLATVMKDAAAAK